jgi:hypothetical protein
MLKGIAFDLEGTSVNVESAHHEGHIKAASDMGIYIDLPSAIEKIPHFIGGPDNLVAEDFLRFGNRVVNSDNVQLFIERKAHHYDRLLKTIKIAARPGLAEVIEEAKKNRIENFHWFSYSSREGHSPHCGIRSLQDDTREKCGFEGRCGESKTQSRHFLGNRKENGNTSVGTNCVRRFPEWNPRHRSSALHSNRNASLFNTSNSYSYCGGRSGKDFL